MEEENANRLYAAGSILTTGLLPDNAANRLPTSSSTTRSLRPGLLSSNSSRVAEERNSPVTSSTVPFNPVGHDPSSEADRMTDLITRYRVNDSTHNGLVFSSSLRRNLGSSSLPSEGAKSRSGGTDSRVENSRLLVTVPTRPRPPSPTAVRCCYDLEHPCRRHLCENKWDGRTSSSSTIDMSDTIAPFCPVYMKAFSDKHYKKVTLVNKRQTFLVHTDSFSAGKAPVTAPSNGVANGGSSLSSTQEIKPFCR